MNHSLDKPLARGIKAVIVVPSPLKNYRPNEAPLAFPEKWAKFKRKAEQFRNSVSCSLVMLGETATTRDVPRGTFRATFSTGQMFHVEHWTDLLRTPCGKAGCIFF